MLERAWRGRASWLLLLLLASCGGASDDACHGVIPPGALVTGAALFRVDLYDGLSCAALSAADFPVPTLSRSFGANAPIQLDAPPGHYAIVVTSYADTGATTPLGSACSEGALAAGARSCLSLALDAVDLASDPPVDLGANDLLQLVLDLAYVPGAVLATDDFQRPDQSGWGTAGDGQHWGGSANIGKVFTIAGGTGAAGNSGNATYSVELGPTVGDAEVLTSGTMTGTGGRWGAELHSSGNMTSYGALLDGATLTLRRVVNGAAMVIASTNFVATSGTSYTIRFRVVGNQLRVRAWPSGTAEPTGWTLAATDPTPLAPGLAGLRFSLPGPDTARVTAFQVTAQ